MVVEREYTAGNVLASVAMKANSKPPKQKPDEPRIISRPYLSPLGKSTVGVQRIRDAVRAVKASKEQTRREK